MLLPLIKLYIKTLDDAKRFREKHVKSEIIARYEKSADNLLNSIRREIAALEKEGMTLIEVTNEEADRLVDEALERLHKQMEEAKEASNVCNAVSPDGSHCLKPVNHESFHEATTSINTPIGHDDRIEWL